MGGEKYLMQQSVEYRTIFILRNINLSINSTILLWRQVQNIFFQLLHLTFKVWVLNISLSNIFVHRLDWCILYMKGVSWHDWHYCTWEIVNVSNVHQSIHQLCSVAKKYYYKTKSCRHSRNNSVKHNSDNIY